MDKTKIGEIFRLDEGDQISMTCIRCTEEFSEFAAFTLHIEHHFMQDEIPIVNSVKEEATYESDDDAFAENFYCESLDEGPKLETEEVKVENIFIDHPNASETDICHSKPILKVKQQSKEIEKMKSTKKRRTQVTRSNKDTQSGPIQVTKSMKFECFLCHEAKKTLYSLQDHMKPHIGYSKFSCRHCSKVFATRNYVYRHMKNVHSKETIEHECYLCKKQLKTPLTLKSHMEMHYKQPVRCVSCRQEFKTPKNLRLHKNRYIFQKSESNKCQFCDKKFSLSCGKLKHLNTKHKKLVAEAKKLICEYCAREFRFNCDLQSHTETHKNEYIKCDICAAQVKLYNLKAHQETHTRTMAQCSVCDKIVTKKHLSTHMKLHRSDLIFKCTRCPDLFDSKAALRRHICSVHNTHYKYKCDICQKAFKRSDKLLIHRRSHPEKMPFSCSKCNKGFLIEQSLRVHDKNHHNLESNGN